MMDKTVHLFVLCVAVCAATGSAVPQSGTSSLIVSPEIGMKAAGEKNGVYSEEETFEQQEKGMLRGHKNLSALPRLVGAASVMVLLFLLLKCFVEIRKKGYRGSLRRRLAGESGEVVEVECQQEESNERSGHGSRGESEEGWEEAIDGNQGDEEENAAEFEEEELQYDFKYWEPRDESTLQWVNKRASKAHRELEKRQNKLSSGDQMALNLNDHIERLQKLIEEMCDLLQKESVLRERYFSLKARIERESTLETMLERTRYRLWRTEKRSTDAMSRVSEAIGELKKQENRWCEEHDLLPLHEQDPGFTDWSYCKGKFIDYENEETERRRKALESGEDVYSASERLNKKRIQKLEFASSKYQEFLVAQREYFQKKQEAADEPGRSDLQESFQKARRKLYDSKRRADEAFEEHYLSTVELARFEEVWCEAHGKEKPKSPYTVPRSQD